MQADPDYEGGANAVSLRQAQRNYVQFGASELRFIGRVVTTPYEKDTSWQPVSASRK